MRVCAVTTAHAKRVTAVPATPAFSVLSIPRPAPAGSQRYCRETFTLDSRCRYDVKFSRVPSSLKYESRQCWHGECSASAQRAPNVSFRISTRPRISVSSAVAADTHRPPPTRQKQVNIIRFAENVSASVNGNRRLRGSLGLLNGKLRRYP